MFDCTSLYNEHRERVNSKTYRVDKLVQIEIFPHDETSTSAPVTKYAPPGQKLNSTEKVDAEKTVSLTKKIVYLFAIEEDENGHTGIQYANDGHRNLHLTTCLLTEFWKGHSPEEYYSPHIVFLRINTSFYNPFIHYRFLCAEVYSFMYHVATGAIPIYPCLNIISFFYPTIKETRLALKSDAGSGWPTNLPLIRDYSLYYDGTGKFVVSFFSKKDRGREIVYPLYTLFNVALHCYVQDL